MHVWLESLRRFSRPLAYQCAVFGFAGAFPVFTVPQMADFLFNRADPAACVAALRLLRDDRLYFKQASREGRQGGRARGGGV